MRVGEADNGGCQEGSVTAQRVGRACVGGGVASPELRDMGTWRGSAIAKLRNPTGAPKSQSTSDQTLNSRQTSN